MSRALLITVCTACLAGDCRFCDGYLRRNRHDPCEHDCPNTPTEENS